MNPHGIVHRDELLAAGVSTSSIARRYRRVLPSVYVHGELNWIGRCHAVAAWKPSAVLSHRTAARLYGWIDQPAVVEATLPRAERARPPSWLTLRRRDLPIQSRTEILGLPVVTREQALVDCAAVMEPTEVARLVDQRLVGGRRSRSAYWIAR